MAISKRLIAFFFSAACFILLWFVPLSDTLPEPARRTLALTVLAILWWVFKVIPAGFTSLFLIAGFLLFRVAEPAVVLTLWTRPMIWLIISSFLMAAAVSKSGLARRIALLVLRRFATTYPRMILLIYLLGLLLSLLIPQPFPRALLMMAIIRQVIDFSGASRKTAVSMGFAVFSSLTATSMFFLTGDVLLNISTVELSGESITWLRWMELMAVPALVASTLMLGLHFLVFGFSHHFAVDESRLAAEMSGLGCLSRTEVVTLGWISAALLFWVSDAITGIDPAWVAVGAVIGLSLPGLGDVLEIDDINSGISWPVILFITGAFAIGAVSSSSGLSGWLAHTLLPLNPPQNPFAFASLVAAAGMGVHMLVGSAFATLSVTVPAMVSYAALAGWDPLFPTLLLYSAVSIHFLLPFHNVILLIGEGETGGYSAVDTLRYGLPLTLVAWLVMLGVELPWWKLVGLI